MGRGGIAGCGDWLTRWALAPYAVLSIFYALRLVSRGAPGALGWVFSSVAMIALAILLNPWLDRRAENLKSESSRRAWEVASGVLLFVLLVSVLLAIVFWQV
ncbi:MAG: hypothetical protein FJ291_17000 [Planctomycetes bacterium]|nr:hypothetical protein [Planctomycetota bacterium]